MEEHISCFFDNETTLPSLVMMESASLLLWNYVFDYMASFLPPSLPFLLRLSHLLLLVGKECTAERLKPSIVVTLNQYFPLSIS